MIKIKLVSVGKIKEKSLQNLIDEYKKRITRYAKIEDIIINDQSVCDNPSDSEIKLVLEKEAKEISKHINDKSFIITMCVEGNLLNSPELSKKIDKISLENSEITFIIGSSHGILEEIKQKSHFNLSMSKMTFPHNLAKLMLIEQIYRAFKISKAENYHK